MIDTPFGPRFLFDAHTHFFNRGFLDGLAQQVGSDATAISNRLGWELPPPTPEEFTAKWLAEMDRHGVDRLISMHTLPGDVESAGKGIAASNGRLVGYLMVNPTAGG